MVKLIELEPQVFVAGQLVPEDFAEIAARGIRTVVNNRPDGEAEGQMPTATAALAAARHGLDYHYQPARNFMITEDRVVSPFAEALADLPRPILFYCRTGTRCTILWTQASAARLGADKVLRIAQTAGYDLSHVREVVDARAGQTGRSHGGQSDFAGAGAAA